MAVGLVQGRCTLQQQRCGPVALAPEHSRSVCPLPAPIICRSQPADSPRADDKVHEMLSCPPCSTSNLSCPPSPACTGRPSAHSPLPPSAGALDDLEPVPGPATATVTATSFAAAPTSTCDVSPDILETYGRHSVRLSRAHEGSGYRVQEFLRKLGRGERVQVAVIGGSSAYS